MATYLFPCSIIVLKLLLKLFVGQDANRVDVYKALLAFPIDAAFLSVSYASAILLAITNAQPNSMPVVTSWAIFSFGMCMLIPVIALCRKSEKAFITDKKVKRGTIYSGVSIGLSSLVLLISINIGSVIQ